MVIYLNRRVFVMKADILQSVSYPLRGGNIPDSISAIFPRETTLLLLATPKNHNPFEKRSNLKEMISRLGANSFVLE